MIKVNHLSKTYGSNLAVDDISFHIEKGHIYGFLGPNGAGKSTTMNIITGCLAATSGEVLINGYDIYKEPVRAKSCIGYLPEIPPLYADMTPYEYLRFVGEAKGIDPFRLTQHVEDVMNMTHIENVRDRLIRNLSKGYKQRVGIAQAILGDPEIIILDEPTVGLDPLQIIEIRELIKELGQEHTVILSSHILSEISAVCDRIIIISHGKIAARDTIENLTASKEGGRILSLDIRGDMQKVCSVIESLKDTVSTSVTHGLSGCIHATVETASGVDIREDVFRLFAKHDLPIIQMNSNDVSLEDVFLRLTSDNAVSSYDSTSRVAPQDSADAPSGEGDSDTVRNETTTDDDDYKPLFGGRDGGDE